jgi:hypothetical protein
MDLTKKEGKSGRDQRVMQSIRVIQATMLGFHQTAIAAGPVMSNQIKGGTRSWLTKM